MRAISISSILSVLCVTFLAGCNATKIIPITTSAPALPASTVASYEAGSVYQAYGDSITEGYSLSSPAQAYPALIAQDKQFVLSNYAIGGDQACDVPTRQIFPNITSTSVSNPPLYTLMIGTNDEDTRDSDYLPIFALCHQASIAWLALPENLKVLANSNAVVASGPGSIETAGHWNSWMTSTLGSFITFSITLAHDGPIYLWPRIADNDSGAFSYALDQTVMGSFSTSPGVTIQTQNGSDNSLEFIRIPSASAGAHTVTFTQTSSGGTMRIVAIGAPDATGQVLPLVVVSDPPLQLAGSSAPCNQYPTRCSDYLTQVLADIAIFTGDGLNVVYVDNHPTMHAAAAEMNDALHPNPLGQSELRTAFETVLP